MIISVWIKLFLSIFNYKVIFQCFHYFYLKNKFVWKNCFNYKTIARFIIIWLNITLIKQRRLRWVFVRNKNFNTVILFLLVNCWMTWNMFLLEHWKNSDYFILSVKAFGWKAYCFHTSLKMEHIRKSERGGGLIVYVSCFIGKAFSAYLFCFLVYRLNLLLFRVTLSVHSKVCKVHLKSLQYTTSLKQTLWFSDRTFYF